MTWTQEQADKARRLVESGRLSPEKRGALEARLREHSTASGLSPSGSTALSEDADLAALQARALVLNSDPAGLGAENLSDRMQSDRGQTFQVPQSAQEFENLRKKTTRTPEEEERLNRARLQVHGELYNDKAVNASKLRDFDLPAEFTPPAADLMTKLNPTAWGEPSVERFMADMGQTLSPSDTEKAKTDPENLHAYKVYRDKKWAEALAQAQELGVPIVRNAFVPGLLENLQKGNTMGAAGNVTSGIKTADAAVRGAGNALSLGAADWVDRQLRPEGSAEAEENARQHGTANTLGKVAGYLAPQGAGNAIFSGAKGVLSKVLPKAAQGGYLEAAASGALAAPAAGAIERGFSADPEQRAFDPDRMLIESLLGFGFGLGGHALGALPKKGAQVIQRDNPLLETGEQRLGIRLGPLGGVHLPPAARAAEAERLAMPIDSRPGSATEMLVDRIRPKYAEAGLREAEGLKGKLEQETGAYFASPEGQARVPVDKTIEAAKRRFDALMDDEARVMPGQEGSADLARQMEEKLESFGGGAMNAKQLDEFIDWVDKQADAATKRGAKDPLLDDFMRAAREDRQQFAANPVTDEALGAPVIRQGRSAAESALASDPGTEDLGRFISVERGSRTQAPSYPSAQRYLDEAGGRGLVAREPVFRGQKMTDEDIARLVESGEMQVPEVWSASFDPDLAAFHSSKRGAGGPPRRPVVFEIRNAKAVPVDTVPGVDTFQETLLPAGQKLRVVGRSTDDSGRERIILDGGLDPKATLSDGTEVSGLAAMKAKQETQISALDRDLANAGLPREFRGREPGFSGQPGEVRLDPKTEVPQLNNALKNAYKPAASGDQRRAVEGFAKKAGVYDDLRALGATQVGEELRNMGRLFGATTHSGTRYGRIANTALPWLRAMASDGRIPSRVLEFVRNLRAGLNTPGGGSPIARFKGGYNSPLPGPWDFAADPLGTTSMQGLALRGGAPSKFRPGIEAASDPFGLKSEQEQVDPTMTEEDVLNLARLIESTREQETRP